jgi:type IV pilus assembly protein PilY1
MFRPDAAGSPRWLGNLKQYQLIRNAAGTLVLGDAQAGPAGPQPAISSAGTGFISPNAVSFWTSINPAKEPDDVGGFYRFDPKGVPPTGYDSPDGEVVEKGGVAQQVRLENLFADFGATAGSSANPRRLYTYCPRGSNCISDLTDSTNQFSISNLGIGAAAFGGSTPADRDRVIRWFRGEDNFGDEKGPGGRVTVWPSIHGDVLHSRPLVVNYGDSRGIVVFYGANDGVFRAVNGNKTAAISSIPAGGELWGLVLPEHYGSINRLRINSPELKFPSTSLPSARPKDYFIDGATGSYQQLKADGTIDKAYLFLTMRRGGRMIYALDVSDPTKPAYMWSISPAKLGFGELGQTWSRPRVTLLQRDAVSGTANPVLVFGAGYDPDQDTEPPSKDAMGRGIFVVDARKGELIWSATPSCLTSSTCLNVPGMTHAVPSDIAFVDRDGDGYTDKFYFADLGGNIWRTDVNTSSPSGWIVTKLAALGCNTGICATGTTPRKFFFPPSVLSIKGSGAIGSYDAISIASGDREHPLKSAAPQSSYNVRDRFFMVKDTGTVLGKPETSDVTPAGLFDATSTLYDDSLNGFYKSFAPGEKAVNAPLAVNGSIFYATNRPIDKTQTCAANLGEAKAYAVSPFSGSQVSNVLPGGGLAPSAVTGLITIETTTDGKTTSSEEKFCIGCGISSQDGGAPCLSSLDQCSFNPAIPKNLRRTYWYKK